MGSRGYALTAFQTQFHDILLIPPPFIDLLISGHEGEAEVPFSRAYAHVTLSDDPTAV